jgi:RNA polymerase sigma-70 factor (ECF subfamily)
VSENDDFQKAVMLNKDTIFRIAYAYCRNHFDAEDICQEVFLKLYRHGSRFNDQDHEKAWLIRVAINQCKDFLRRKWVISFFRGKDCIAGYESENQSEVVEAVFSLPIKYRMPIHLYYYEDYSIREIAEILGTSETAIQTQLQRARMMLRKKIREEFEDESK